MCAFRFCGGDSLEEKREPADSGKPLSVDNSSTLPRKYSCMEAIVMKAIRNVFVLFAGKYESSGRRKMEGDRPVRPEAETHFDQCYQASKDDCVVSRGVIHRGAAPVGFQRFGSQSGKGFLCNPALADTVRQKAKKSRKKVSQTLDMRTRSSYICSPFKKWLSQTRGKFFEKRWCICQLFLKVNPTRYCRV